MKQPYVPLEKRSKKQQKEYHALQRKGWGEMSPITRKVENAKIYNRKKSKQRWEYEPCLDFLSARKLTRPRDVQVAYRICPRRRERALRAFV